MINEKEIPKIVKDFLNYSSNLNMSKGTIYEYRYDIINLLKFIKWLYMGKPDLDVSSIPIIDIDSKFLNSIDVNDLYEYMSYLKDKYSDTPATRARKIGSIRTFFKYLHVKAKIVDYNPAKDIERPKLGKRLPKYLTLEQSIALLHVVKNKKLNCHQKNNCARDYAIITLLLNCGLRLAELVSINIGHIKFNDKVLTVIGKGDKERTIYLNKACLIAIKDYLKVRPFDDSVIDKQALFLSINKKRISRRTVQHLVKENLKLVKGAENLSTHKLRHTAATLMYQYGNTDINTLKEILGHESIATTDIYTHVDNSQIREAIENNPLANYIIK